MNDLITRILADRALVRALTDEQLDLLKGVLEAHLALVAPADPMTLIPEMPDVPAAAREILPDTARSIVAYVDGACSGNPGPGGWGVHFAGLGVEASGGAEHTTNNQMEIVAATEALLRVPAGATVEIVTDSKLVVETMNGAWKRKTNIELWDALDAARAGKTVTFTWVKGHNGNPGNNRADELAQRESARMRERLARAA